MKRGRKPVNLTPEQIHTVRTLASRRIHQEIIARSVGIHLRTLTKNYNHILREGYDAADCEAYKAFYDEAVEKRKPWALKQYSKWHLQYKEPPREIHATVNSAELLAEIQAADAATFIDEPIEEDEDEEEPEEDETE